MESETVLVELFAHSQGCREGGHATARFLIVIAVSSYILSAVVQ